MRSSRARYVAGLAVVAVPALALTGCGDGGGSDVEASGPDGFDASPAYLAQVVADSTSQPYRFDGSMSLGMVVEGDVGGFQDVPMSTGSVDGTRTHQRVDLEPFIEALAEEGGAPPPMDLDEVDLALDIVADGRTVYLRAPDFDVLAANGRPGARVPPMVEALRDLGDSWGRVDLDALGDGVLPGDVQGLLESGQGADPSALLALVADARGAEELDGEEIDGEQMVGVAADVSLVESLEGSGTDLDAVVEQMRGQFGSVPPDLREVLAEMVFPMEVWIDDDGHVRRLAQDLGQASLELMRAVDEDAADDIGVFNQVITVDFYDYGDESIEVAVPDPAETVPITDRFVAMQDELSG